MLEKLWHIFLVVGGVSVPTSFFIADLVRLDKERNDDLRVTSPVFEPNGESPFKGLGFAPTKAGNPSPAPIPREVVPESSRGFGPCYMVLHHERFLRRPCGLLLLTAGTLFVSGVILPQSFWGLLLVVPGLFCFVCSFLAVKFMRDGLAVCLMGITVRRLRYDKIIAMRQYMRGYRPGGYEHGDLIGRIIVEQSDYDAGERAGVHAWWNIDLKTAKGEPLTLSAKAYPGLKQAVIFWLDNMA